MKTPQDLLAELEDKFILGEIMADDYRDLKNELITEIRASGGTVSSEHSVTVAEIKDTIGTSFCFVPDGPFIYGQDDEWIELKCPYYISKYPVTVNQFMAFLANVDIGYTDEDYEMLNTVSPEPDCPASHLSFNDAKEFCRWLRR